MVTSRSRCRNWSIVVLSLLESTVNFLVKRLCSFETFHKNMFRIFVVPQDTTLLFGHSLFMLHGATYQLLKQAQFLSMLFFFSYQT